MTRSSFRGAPRRRRRWVGALLAAAVVLVTWLLAGPTAWATVDAPVDAGQVEVSDAIIRTQDITHGDATTQFSLRLPANATCPGDSANDQWRVQSFSIPVGDDPVDIRYGSIGPEPSVNGRYALFMVDTRPFVHQLTRQNPGRGQPGLINTLPAFSFEVVAGERIPGGRYRVGIACTYFGKTARYWDTEIVIAEQPDANPPLLTWRLASEPASVMTPPETTTDWTLPLLAGLGITIAGLVFWRRRSTHLSPRSRTGTPPSVTSLSKES